MFENHNKEPQTNWALRCTFSVERTQMRPTGHTCKWVTTATGFPAGHFFPYNYDRIKPPGCSIGQRGPEGLGTHRTDSWVWPWLFSKIKNFASCKIWKKAHMDKVLLTRNLPKRIRKVMKKKKKKDKTAKEKEKK